MQDSSKRLEITGSTLKIIALVTMFIDHTAATILQKILLNTSIVYNRNELIDVYWVMRLIGRMAFPIYCFLLVEGFKYTSNRAKYAFRLFIFAFISEIPFDLAFNNGIYDMKSNNVFFTLFIGLLTIIVIDWIKGINKIEKSKSTLKWILTNFLKCIVMMAVIFGMMIIAEFILCSDYGAAGVGCIVIMYLLNANKDLAFLFGVVLLGFLTGNIEFIAIFMLIPVNYYNGKKGISMKYFFYGFYPVHLLILSAITYWLQF